MKFNYDSKTKKSLTWQKILALGLIAIIAVALIGWLGLRQWYKQNLTPLSNEFVEQVVTIDSGSTTIVIADQLETEELIRSATAFNWYVNGLDDQQYLQAGTYVLSPSYSVQEIVDILIGGKVDTDLVTILPGKWLKEVAEGLVAFGFSEEEVNEAINAKYNHPLLKDKPPEASLEGYIFPETYQVTRQSTAQSVVEHTFDVFYDQLTNELLAGITAQGLTFYEGVTLASIVQGESSVPQRQQQIAQVFLNRLELGMPLGADPTFRYAADVAGVEPTVDIDSPYNTRIYPGLPPGPISNFNFSALEAVAFPTENDYLYFVAGDDGVIYYSETFAEHQENVRNYCFENCQL